MKMKDRYLGSKHESHEHHGGEMEGAGELGGAWAGGRGMNKGPSAGMNRHETNMESPMRKTPGAERDVPNRSGKRSGDDM